MRDDIGANTLALKLFKDSTAVSLRAQGRMILGAFRLLILAIVPMLLMIVPVCLVLGQLSLWYQFRPLRVGEEALVTVKLNGVSQSYPEVRLKPTSAVEVTVGPVRVRSRDEICWNIRAEQAGKHRLEFQSGEHACTKDLAIGEGFMRLGRLRPGWRWTDILFNPSEEPFPPHSPSGQSRLTIRPDRPGQAAPTPGSSTGSWYP